MTLASTGTLETDAKIQYLRTLVRGEALCQFDLFPSEVENAETLKIGYYIRGSALYFPPVNSLLKKSAMRLRRKRTRGLKVRCYAARLIHLNGYLSSFLGETLANKMYVTELNNILSNIIPNIWSKQAYVQGFYCESISFKNHANMFERMEIS